MTHLTSQAHTLFATQHGVASVAQLRAAGLTLRQITQLQHVGDLVLVLRGCYRTRSARFDELSRCAAVSLARPDTVIAGPAAGRIWGLRRLPSDHRIHIVSPRASNPAIARWVIPYRTDAIHAHDVIAREDGIRVTSLARTAFDLARWLPADDLLSVIEQATQQGRLSDSDLREVAVDWLSPRRPWARTYLEQLDRRFDGGAAESHPEVRVAVALRNAGVGGLVRQHPVDLPGYGRARFDLAVVDLKWAVEVDVHPRHDETMGQDLDRQRDVAAARDGWLVTRISRTAYERSFDETIQSVAEVYRTISRRAQLPA